MPRSARQRPRGEGAAIRKQHHLDAGHSWQRFAAGELRLDGSADFRESSRPRHDLVAPVRQGGPRPWKRGAVQLIRVWRGVFGRCERLSPSRRHGIIVTKRSSVAFLRADPWRSRRSGRSEAETCRAHTPTCAVCARSIRPCIRLVVQECQGSSCAAMKQASASVKVIHPHIRPVGSYGSAEVPT
jgi:hypothetical protein